MSRVLESLRWGVAGPDQASDASTAPPLVVYLNCMSLTDPAQLYPSLLTQCQALMEGE